MKINELMTGMKKINLDASVKEVSEIITTRAGKNFVKLFIEDETGMCNVDVWEKNITGEENSYYDDVLNLKPGDKVIIKSGMIGKDPFIYEKYGALYDISLGKFGEVVAVKE